MKNEFLVQEEANKEIMRRLFYALGQGDTKTIDSFLSEQCVFKIPDGHPVGGTYKGIADITKYREKAYSVLGISRIDIREILAGGASTVMVLLDVDGTDAAGKQWSMPCVDRFSIVDEKITEMIAFFHDTARLREIAGGRQ
jgi:ketosteroid isomerase-like protein